MISVMRERERGQGTIVMALAQGAGDRTRAPCSTDSRCCRQRPNKVSCHRLAENMRLAPIEIGMGARSSRHFQSEIQPSLLITNNHH